MSSGPDLVLLTAEFPFGNKAETFLETEIEILAERFRRVFVLPSHRSEILRPLPANATLVEMGWLDPPGAGARKRALLSAAALRVLGTTLRAPGNWGPYTGSARMYLDILARNVLKSRDLDEFVRRNDLSDAIFYDYWFENSTVALALLRSAGVVSTAVSRARGFDVYDERWDGRPVPFREFKAGGLDAVFTDSDFGRRYLHERLPALASKIHVRYQGVRAQPEPPWAVAEEADGAGDVPLVVSCGSMIPIKRIHLLPEVLAGLSRPLRWVHLGDGPERPRVERAASRAPERVRCELLGHVDNAQVLDFYRANRVAAIVSLSTSEGLPVSMMEALSFGIPIVAVGVNGVPEIVNDETGILLDAEAGLEQIEAGLTAALEPGRFDRARIRSFFEQHYEAHANYNAFADVLIDLQKGQSPAG